MDIEIFDIRDPWVQEFLWQHLEPTDIRHDYTKYDVVKYVHDCVINGDTVLAGNKEAGVMFRCVRRNPLVLEPHIMGNGMRMRSVTKAAIPMAWSLGYERIMVWTQYPQIAAAMLSVGFTQDASIPRCHLQNGQLMDLHVLSLEKGNWNEQPTSSEFGNP